MWSRVPRLNADMGAISASSTATATHPHVHRIPPARILAST
ncbi:hypothetical protein HMPREF9056_00554 [Actinomyces sp. oral taxon 170 str. F0386]|nr:hypothetical protein HMPREF9056_00554 [Actinomyces sp. oral taxon 170 str. F0386]